MDDFLYPNLSSSFALPFQVAKRSSPLDAQLFLIRHLLFLREQIAPFDVDFSSTDTDLDFSHMRDQLRRLLAGESSLFSFSANNPVVQMLGRGGPRVVQSQVMINGELKRSKDCKSIGKIK